MMSAVATVLFGGIAQAQATDLYAQMDVSSGAMTVHIAAGEPLRSPILSILFAPGATAAEAPDVCTSRWHVDDVRVAATDGEAGRDATELTSHRYSCSIADISEGHGAELFIPIVVSEAAAALPMTATVGIRSGVIVLETVATRAEGTGSDPTVCNPGGLTASGEYLPTTPFAASGTVTGSVSTELSEPGPVVELVGIDSCNQWIMRTVPATSDGEFSFDGLLPGKYAVGLSDTAHRTAIALRGDSMSANDITI